MEAILGVLKGEEAAVEGADNGSSLPVTDAAD
jgi:hypothetical protein